MSNVSTRLRPSVGCPLLLFWPLVCEVGGGGGGGRGGGGRACGDEGEDAVMEMRLRENPQQFGSALLQLSARYLFVEGAQVGGAPAGPGDDLTRRSLARSLTVCVCVCVFAGVCLGVCRRPPQETPHGLESLRSKVSEM